MGKNKAGRPSVITTDTIEQLNIAFAMGCTDIEACLFAGVSPSALYRYIERNPEYGQRKEELKHTPTIKARQTLVKSIEKGDDVSARWYLERKRPEEFGNRSELNVTAKGGLTIEERSDALSAFLERFTAKG